MIDIDKKEDYYYDEYIIQTSSSQKEEKEEDVTDVDRLINKETYVSLSMILERYDANAIIQEYLRSLSVKLEIKTDEDKIQLL